MTIHATQGQFDQNVQAHGVQDTPSGSWEQQAARPEAQQAGEPPTGENSSGSMDFIKQLMQLLMSFMQMIMQLLGGRPDGLQGGAEEPEGIKNGRQAGVSNEYGEMPIQTGEEESV